VCQIAAEEQEDRNGYWENELSSLGIAPKRKNELNTKDELQALTDNLKQVYYQNFKLAYNEEGSDESRFDYII
jgi:hypothetical protein